MACRHGGSKSLLPRRELSQQGIGVLPSVVACQNCHVCFISGSSVRLVLLFLARLTAFLRLHVVAFHRQVVYRLGFLVTGKVVELKSKGMMDNFKHTHL